ncbi:hypothetical protein L195_g036098, partial [Trifolium pratense]
KEVHLVRWNVPEDRWVKMNTDGASKGERLADCGGIIREVTGVVVLPSLLELEVLL